MPSCWWAASWPPRRPPATSEIARTERLVIRELEPDDLDAIHVIQSDPLVGRYLGRAHTKTIEETRERFERMLGFQRVHGYTLWAVTLADGGELIGDCGLIPLEGSGPEVELGYRFGSASWGKGYATEAASACRNIGFDRFGLERIYVDIHPENEGSQNVARKLGARLIGPAKHNEFDVLRFVLERLPQ